MKRHPIVEATAERYCMDRERVAPHSGWTGSRWTNNEDEVHDPRVYPCEECRDIAEAVLTAAARSGHEVRIKEVVGYGE